MIGETTFTLAEERVTISVNAPQPVTEQTFSPDYLRSIRFRNADQRIDVLSRLPEIMAQYEILRAEVENVVDVELVAAMQVEPAEHERLVQALKRRLGREVRVSTRIDASLIGGAVVRAGDLVIDGSLKGRLERLSSAMTA